MRAVVLTITLLASAAYADPEKAKQLTTEAEALVASGDLLGAAAKFRAAFDEEPIAEHMCNTGVAYHKLQDLPRSYRYLNRCVTMDSSLDSTYRENLRKVLETIEQKLLAGDFTPFDVVVQPPIATLAIDGGKPYDEPFVGGGRMWLPWGTYSLIAHSDGFDEKHIEVKAEGHSARPLSITLEKTVVKPPIEKPKVYVPAPRPSKIPAIVATATAGAAGIIALVTYAQAAGYVDDAESTTITFDEYDDLREKANSRHRMSIAFGVSAGIVGAAAGFLWWRALRDPGRIEVTATTNTVGIAGRF